MLQLQRNVCLRQKTATKHMMQIFNITKLLMIKPIHIPDKWRVYKCMHSHLS